jgi:hypothetical protein
MPPKTSKNFLQHLLGTSSYFRYAALYLDGQLDSIERPGLDNATAAETDKYEELLVNPGVLTLLVQRGSLDCGGLAYMLVRYGRFFQYVQPIRGGHISVSIEQDADPMALIPEIRDAIAKAGL